MHNRIWSSFIASGRQTAWAITCIAISWVASQLAWSQESDLASAIASIKRVQPGGQFHDEALVAMQRLNQATAEQVPLLLEGMDGANKLALNWLRGAIQTALSRGGTLPRAQIQAYFDDRSHSDMGRLMAFELLTEGDQASSRQMVPQLIDDPSLPLRYMGIAAYLEKAEKAEAAESLSLLAVALPSARDVGQIQTIAKMFRQRGIEINVQRQLGFLANWHIAGPFDNTGEAGFDKALGPEKNLKEIDLQASYDDGKDGQTVKWIEFNSIEPTAVVNLNQVIGELKGAVAYAYTEFDSESDQTVDIRIGSINGNKVWVNGEEVLNNEIYHVGMQADQFVSTAQLKKGKNQILFKVCQNEQTQPWANQWVFQLRICDSTGKAIHPVPPKPQTE